MNNTLISNILKKLKADNPNFKESGSHLQQLKCPVCGKNEAFTYLDKPFSIICPRGNKCGETTPVKSLYPEIFSNFAKHNPPTPTEPKATAKAYLQSRGLNPELFEFAQSSFKIDGKTYPTVLFEFNGIKQHRLIDYTGKDKNRIIGSYTGKVYRAIKNEAIKSVWITEGIIDTLSFSQCGFNSIATLSSVHCPEDYYEAHKDCEYVIAFDNDLAGHKAIRKHIECFKKLNIKYRIALSEKGKDWNDLLLAKKLENESVINDCYWRGELFTAISAEKYFEIYLKKYPDTKNLIFEFSNKTYLGNTKENSEGELIYNVTLILDCTIKILHSILDDTDNDRPQIEHYINIYSEREGQNKIKLSAKELSDLSAFKYALQNCRQLFYGNGHVLNHLAAYLFSTKPKKIRALSTVGYDSKSNCFVFPQFAYDVNGKRIAVNNDKFFSELNLRPFLDSSDSSTSKLAKMDLKAFIGDLNAAYGYKGLLALGFYVSALFSHLVFNEYGFFPFLSLYGDPHAGKSFITKLLNRCFFVDGEGQTMTSSNTAKGELRKISQKSSLVCALLEGRRDKSRFDYDGVLPLYNRNALYSRATTDQSNRTHDLTLKAAISFVWNHECFTLKAAKERVISLHFAESDMTEKTGAAWEKLNQLSPEQLAYLGDYILTNRKHFEAKLIGWVKEYSVTLKEQGVKVSRIADNHAVALGGIVALLEFLKIDDIGYNELALYTVSRAKNKLETAKTESHLADYFFESIEGLDSGAGVVTQADCLIIHLPTVLTHLQNAGNSIDKRELLPQLKACDRFICTKSSREFGGVKECYYFKNP